MDIADEIQVATILEMQLSHSHFNPFLTTLVFQWRQGSLPNIVLPVRNFCFVYFLDFVVVVVALSFVVALQG